MTDYDILIPAQIYITEIEPVIADEHRVYAHQLKAKLGGKIEIDLEEYTGIKVQKYLHQQTECLLEIIEAEFVPDKRENEEDEMPDTVELEYLGYRYGCHFFPPPDDTTKRNGKLNAQLYQAFLEEKFPSFSEAGFPLEPFETYPIFQMTNGTVLLMNKDIFKEKLRSTKKGKNIHLKIETAHLLSVASPRKLPTKEELEERKKQKAAKFEPVKKKKWGIF